MQTLGKFEAQYSDLAVILSLEMLRLIIGGKRFIKWFSFASLLSRVIGAVWRLLGGKLVWLLGL